MTRIETHIVLSTAHLTQEVSAALTSKGADTMQMARDGSYLDSLIVCEFAYGHWVKVLKPTGSADEEIQEHRGRMNDLPECLRACMIHANQFGATWILFDLDEPVIATLPAYDW